MKMLECKTENGFVRFALDSVMSYGIIFQKKAPRKPAHHLLQVVLKPVKTIDDDYGNGKVIDLCEKLELPFETFELAESAVTVIDV